MQGPHRLPTHLKKYQTYLTDEELFHAFIPHVDDFILFFQYACEDQTWAQHHPKLLRLILRLAAKQFYLGDFPLEAAQRLVKIIQAHHSLLNPFLFFRAALFFTLRLRLEEQTILVNSLLFGVCSPVLRDIFQRECFAKLKDEWAFPSLSLPIFRQIEVYILTGTLAELGPCKEGEVTLLLDQANAWGLQDFVHLIQISITNSDN